MIRRVFIATSSFGEQDKEAVTLLLQAGWEVVRNPHKRTLRPEELVSLAQKCVGIVAGTEPYTPSLLDKLPDLRVISRCGAGLDTVNLAAAAERGIVVKNTPFGPTQAVAELTLGMILSLLRGVPGATSHVRRGEWTKGVGRLLADARIGLWGLGRIGRRLAEMLRGLGASVTGSDNAPDSAWAARVGVDIRPFEELVRSVDVLSVHLPYEPGLHHLIGRDILRAMRPGACLINTSRGGLVDETALAEALKAGSLGGAALDVFETEPYQGPLTNIDNVILTPHIGSYALSARIAMEREAVQNLLAAFETIQGPS